MLQSVSAVMFLCLMYCLFEHCFAFELFGLMTMGVDHGGTRGQVSPEFGVGDANANCPPQILLYRSKKRPVAFKIAYAQIRFRPELCPGPRWES